MAKGRLSILLVFTLVLINLQCVAFCASQSCNGSGTESTESSTVPACHHHHDAPRSQAPTPVPCSHLMVQAHAVRALATPVLAPNVVITHLPVVAAVALPPQADAGTLIAHASSPPDPAVFSPVVLRI
jgi:hypothetical protein